MDDCKLQILWSVLSQTESLQGRVMGRPSQRLSSELHLQEQVYLTQADVDGGQGGNRGNLWEKRCENCKTSESLS